MKKMYAIFLLFNCVFADLARSEIYGPVRGCGQYKIAGIIRKNADRGVLLVVNEKSGSEYQFKPAAGELPKFVGFIDVPIEIVTNIVMLDGTIGEVAAPVTITPILPDPLHPHLNSGFIQLKARKCIKL